MTHQEILDNKPDGATHYEIQDGEACYYARDYMGRWCGIDDSGCLWPMPLRDHDRYNAELIPL